MSRASHVLQSSPFSDSGSCRPVFLEAFAGTAGFTLAVQAAGFHIERPLEAYPQGVYVQAGDVLHPRVLSGLRARIRSGQIWCMQFGLPCRTWGSLARLNGSTRSFAFPAGDGTVEKEIDANRQARITGSLCKLLSQSGGSWSVENPRGSFCFNYMPLRVLLSLPGVCDVHFDQCMFGLTFPHVSENTFVKTATTIRTNIPGFACLARTCDRTHVHSWACGSIPSAGGRVSLSKLAGAYPQALCRKMAEGLLGSGRDPHLCA